MSDKAESMARGALSLTPGVEKLARAGYFAKGVVYTLVGVLGIQAALGQKTGEQATSTGALQTIVEEPLGKFFLVVIAVGLVGYAIWKLVQAVLDPENHEDESTLERLVRRIFYAVSGILHGYLAWRAFAILSGSEAGEQSSASGAEEKASTLLSEPAGAVLLGFGALLILGYGLYELYQAWKIRFDERFALEEVSPGWRKWVITLSRIGTGARGVVFSLIGFYLLQAAIQGDPDQAIGIEGALKKMENWGGGPWLAVAVAAGLLMYGVFVFLKGRYRRINAPS